MLPLNKVQEHKKVRIVSTKMISGSDSVLLRGSVIDSELMGLEATSA